ncbi:disease resistance protein RGA2-like [Papaver somniferum]|uniref:disease resistance protein RGA2-like n=1 Tax=Papaver somniferum TaxID=3469 RepID=UPI000E704E86|nr:disease resistance protein RGA2-like [Papaver somniferum]
MSIVEGIFVNGVTEALKKLVPIIGKEIVLAWGVKDKLKKLQKTVQMILVVIADAERKQLNDAAVGLWLRRLKDVAYDADFVLDEFSYETMRRCERGNRLKHKVMDFVSSSNNPLAFGFKMAKKIKIINKRLDEITEDMKRFHLQDATDNTFMVHGGSSEQRSRQTASSMNESDIIGRDDDKNRLVDILTQVIPSSTSPDTNPENVSVVSIVGMGGLGKTSIAQVVYKDEMVNKLFELTMWVHVSAYFDLEKLLTKIMESSTHNKFDAPSNFSVLVSKVEEQLNGKKYLLVLDDLWNENAEEWERLYSQLLVGAQGSKILITTRKTQVADVVKGSIPPYKLEKLQDDECWSIIEKKAFSPGGALKTANVTSIGREIAKRCSGLPLAAKFLGGLMRSRNKEVNWLSILENDIWRTPESQSTIMPILKLSYDNLSSELKQCFSYCSIFPKDWEINRVTMVQLWIAEGFLDTCNVGNGRSIY